MLHRLSAVALGPCLIGLAERAEAQAATVRAVLFFSPTCPHCQVVIEGTILPLQDQYGDALQVAAISTLTPEGQALYRAAVERFKIPSERLGVPTLIVGQTVLVGSGEIPEQFPGIIRAGLTQGGIAWPDIPGLADLLPLNPDSPSGTPSGTMESAHDPAAGPPPGGPTPGEAGEPDPAPVPERRSLPAWQANWMRDPLGNSLPVFVLVGMLASITTAGYQVIQAAAPSRMARPVWAIPALAVAGQFGPAWLSDRAWLALFAQTASGVLFSIYLTVLEPFVIGATCMWCLSSAVIMTALLWLASSPAGAALRRLRGRAAG